MFAIEPTLHRLDGAVVLRGSAASHGRRRGGPCQGPRLGSHMRLIARGQAVWGLNSVLARGVDAKDRVVSSNRFERRYRIVV